jgi:RimJ/RimL family protein N-acetyltransferase
MTVPSMAERVIRLRPYRRGDLAALTRLLTDPAVMDPVGGPVRHDDVVGILDRYLRPGDPEILAARAAELEDGTYAGSGRLTQGRRDAPEIAYLVLPEHRGRGVATAIARGLVELARAEHGATRVYATVDPENAGSIRVLEKAGLERIEVLRDERGEHYLFSTR